MSPPKQSLGKKDTKIDIDDLPRPPSVFEHPPSSISYPADLTPLSSLSHDILTRPPFPEASKKPSSQKEEGFIIQDNITSDILNELRQADFGSFLETISEEKRPKLTVDEIEKPRFLAAKDAYLAAGKKHLELNFNENAAMNFSCAILSMYLGKDVFAATHLMADLASKSPSSIINTYFFQGAKLLLKGILLKNPSFLVQAEKWLMEDTNHLYKEDVDLIRRALRQSKLQI
ncbi:MAG: hypothetical protein ACFFB2_17215 [Promethearchaeota archaeon]